LKDKKERTILHVDMNSYFATVLEQENPHLRGRAFGVVKSEGRSCIIAASKAAKILGVKTGAYLKDIQDWCPNLLCVPAAFDRYLDTTRRLQKIFTRISPDVHIYSLDEAFIDITDCLQYMYDDALSVAKHIQQNIFDELGSWVTCSVGISHNRLLAKLGSGIAEKGGVLHITHENKDAYLASTPFSEVCGIGYRLEKKLQAMGVSTPYQIRFFSEDQLRPLFGPFWAKELLRIAYGESSHALNLIDDQLPHMKSVGRSITGFRLARDEEIKRMVILNLIEEVTYKTRRMKLAGRQVWIGLRGHDRWWSAHKTLPHYIQHTSEMFDIAYNQLYKSANLRFPVIKFAVRLGLLKEAHKIPLPLFEPWEQKERLSQSLDAISEKYGLFTVKPGTLLTHQIIRPEVTGFLGDRLYYGL
jgi:DNA polymerase-4